jgi:YcaO-like protein with predicted kinase domain
LRSVNSCTKLYFSGTHRVVAPDETLARIASKADLFGVTRVANVTGLDYLAIPVFAAIRPNSRGLSVHQGKGLTPEAAKASAIMEALEWHSGELPFPNAVWSSANSLAQKSYVFPFNLMRGELGRDEIIPWVEGHDLLKGFRTLVPEELATTDYTVPTRRGFGWFQASSNGLAAGNSRPEAQLHAICELIERDAFALWRLLSSDARARTRIDPAAAGDPSADLLMSRYDMSGMVVEAWDITSDIDVPAFFCVIDDHFARPPFLGRFGGAGCHPNAGVALCRALSEAAQSRLTFIAGARDDIPAGSYAVLGGHHNLASLANQNVARPPARVGAVRAASFDTPSVEGDLAAVLSRLAKRGFDSVAEVDLSQPGIGIPCVRVVIPGLEGMSDKSGYQPGKRALRARRQWT